jgi:glutathione S-transferase
MQQPQQQQQQQQQQQPPQLQPGALQQAPGDDGSLYAPPELQSSATFQQQQHQHQHQQHYAALGASPQPLHFDEHYASFPPAYPQAASPSFALTGGLHTPRVPQRQLHHISPLQPTPPQHDHASQSYIQVSPQTQPPQISPQDKSPFANHGQFPDLKLIPNPPNLDLWRERLFDVDEMITLSQDEFQTYFPHIDNVYSHRSTQRHKRHRMVSHYWDCRLKGRPPGTKKSTDPDKKKRKRVARERDLCDVKIKITEFKNIAEYDDLMGHMPPRCSLAGTEFSTYTRRPVQDAITAHSEQQSTFFQPTQMLAQQSLASWDMPPNLGQEDVNMASFDQPPPPLTKSPQRKYYTIQRVNGNGGNGKSDGAAGPHKHSLEESDRVKKNSVVRWLAKIDKERKKSQVSPCSLELFLSLALLLCKSYSLVPFTVLELRVVAGDGHDITMRRRAPLTTPLSTDLSHNSPPPMFPVIRLLRTAFDHSPRSRFYPPRAFFSTVTARYTRPTPTRAATHPRRRTTRRLPAMP